MLKYKVWLLEFGDWPYILRGLNITGQAERVMVGGHPRFFWNGPGIEIKTWSNPITGEHQENVLPGGFGPASYVEVSGDAAQVNAALELFKSHAKPILS